MCLLLLLSHVSRVRLCVTPQTAATRLPHPWDSPGKNTGVGCHFLLQCRKVKSEREVPQSCPTLSAPLDCSLPGSSPSMGFSRQEYWSGVPSPRSLRLLILAGLLCRGGTVGNSSLDVMLVANSEGSKYRKLSLLWPPRLSSSMTLGKGLPVRTPSCLCGC